MWYTVITPAAAEPLTVEELKLHLRTVPGDTTEDAGILAPLITAAREYCETYTGRSLTPQTIEAHAMCFPNRAIDLPRPPVRDVQSVIYVTADGQQHILPAGDYLIETDGDNARLVLSPGKIWPIFDPYPVDPVRIRYSAGYATGVMPSGIRQAMLLLCGHWYNNREAIGTVGDRVKLGVSSLLGQYRVAWFNRG